MFEDIRGPVLFAHRGASAHAPENTVPAFELALEQGADGVELDAKLSADGRVMVIHDASVDRTTGGRGRVRDLSAAEMRALDAGRSSSREFRGARIPTLEEVFETIGKRGIINVELTNYSTPHDQLVETTCALIKQHKMQRQVLFSSFYAANLKKAARLLPEVPRGLLALPGWKGAWARSFVFHLGDFQALHAHISDTDPALIERVHRLGRRIHAWTANTEAEARRLTGWHVDGIFSDDPLIAARGMGRGA
ncbi:MAG TPA: glycerophosphodiester phosphodiesterase family protein [Anaerolineales bacterium]|jgi:glycerophosphoryl diester phosphodiesterase